MKTRYDYDIHTNLYLTSSSLAYTQMSRYASYTCLNHLDVDTRPSLACILAHTALLAGRDQSTWLLISLKGQMTSSIERCREDTVASRIMILSTLILVDIMTTGREPVDGDLHAVKPL